MAIEDIDLHRYQRNLLRSEVKPLQTIQEEPEVFVVEYENPYKKVDIRSMYLGLYLLMFIALLCFFLGRS